MLFGNIYQKLFIYELNNICQYLTIIWRYLTTEIFTMKTERYLRKDIANYRHLSLSGKRALRSDAPVLQKNTEINILRHPAKLFNILG